MGIFGASVAVSFAECAEQDPYFRQALVVALPELAGRRIVVRNMAIGASRQPAQFAILSQYREIFDLTINLDGYSEQSIDQYPRYPIESPMFAEVFFGSGGVPRFLASMSAAWVCDCISRPAAWPLVGRSAAYYLAWRLASLACATSTSCSPTSMWPAPSR